MAHLPSRPIVGGAVAFFVMGLLVASYGPLLSSIRHEFHLSAAGVGLLLSAHFAGSVLGILSAGAVSGRLGLRRRLYWAAALLATGALIAAFAPTWTALLAGVAVAGFGWGGFDLDVNVLFSRAHGVRSGAVLNAISAAFGAGAVAAPLLVGAGAGRVLVFSASAGMALLALALLRDLPSPPEPPREPAGSGTGRPRGLWMMFLLILLFYVAAETGVPGWMPTYLSQMTDSGSGTAPSTATAAAGFWVCFTLGRLLAAPVSLRVHPSRLVPGTLGLASLTLLLAQSTAVAPYAFAVSGLFLAPTFPTTLAWLAVRVPTAVTNTALVLAAASFGPVLALPLIGATVDLAGAHTIPAMLAAISAAAAVLALCAPVNPGERPRPDRGPTARNGNFQNTPAVAAHSGDSLGSGVSQQTRRAPARQRGSPMAPRH